MKIHIDDVSIRFALVLEGNPEKMRASRDFVEAIDALDAEINSAIIAELYTTLRELCAGDVPEPVFVKQRG